MSKLREYSNRYSHRKLWLRRPLITLILALQLAVTGLCFSNLQPSPDIRSVFPAPLLTATSNAGTIHGDNFTSKTVAFAAGNPLATTYVSSTQLNVQIPVAANASGSLALTVQNPAPGGGSSAVFQAPIGVPSIQLTASTSTVALGAGLFIQASVQGTASAVVWTLNGGGSISSSGTYSAPLAMPSSSTAVVSATLASYPSISASFQIALVNPVPDIRSVFPAPLLTATTNAGTVYGNNFTPNTLAFASGAPLATTYVSSTQLNVQIPVAANASGLLALTVQNPAPGGGSSAVFQAPIGVPSIQLTAATSTVALGTGLFIQASVQGTASAVVWTLNGAGSISSNSTYYAPLAMPSTSTVVVIATLASYPSISASFQIALVNPVPDIRSVFPAPLLTATTNAGT